MKQPDGQELMHRIRIGLTGLATVFLLVLLGAVFARFVREGQAERDRVDHRPKVEASADDQPRDPLAELGVAPGNEPPAENSTAP